MLDPINFVQAYHSTREVHREYVHGLDGRSDEKALGEMRATVRRPGAFAWLATQLAALPGERRATSPRRQHA